MEDIWGFIIPAYAFAKGQVTFAAKFTDVNI